MDEMRNVGVTPVETILGYDGLGFLKAIIDGTLPKAPISALLGFDIVDAEPGKAVFEGLPEFRHYNPIGTVHGGLAMTLLDSCMSCAVQTTLAKGELYTTLELKVNLTRAITKDTVLCARPGGSFIAAAPPAPRKATSAMAPATCSRTAPRRA
ncbi:MAG: PaaI family thioesterase [Alphaproteobacteria bacterium]